MITIHCDFHQCSTKKLPCFLKTEVMTNFYHLTITAFQAEGLFTQSDRWSDVVPYNTKIGLMLFFCVASYDILELGPTFFRQYVSDCVNRPWSCYSFIAKTFMKS
jgi:hypothetical protein